MIEQGFFPEAFKTLNNLPENNSGKYVLYWMQSAQRSICNPALEYAASQANRYSKPLVVFFGITTEFPEANLRHYTFMLEGIAELAISLQKRGIKFVVKVCKPEIEAAELAKNAVLAILDFGCLRIQKEWRANFAKIIPCKAIQVETESVIPLETAADKEMFSAAQLRRKIIPLLHRFLKPPPEIKLNCPCTEFNFNGLDMKNLATVLKNLKVDKSVLPVSEFFKGGESEAEKKLEIFISHKLSAYAKFANNPELDFCSNLSPYLHFGQISPVRIACAVKKFSGESVERFLEELIVRRELAMNFVHYNANYDSFACLPDWAQKTLDKHSKDKREYVYSLEAFEKAQTHDKYWNAAQNEMLCTGKMKNYMRMYWGKKILEWSSSPQEAYKIALYLNNKYELDGRDANGFAGVAWCFGKHDRPWTERNIFGMVRYMNAKGLEKKFNMTAYLEKDFSYDIFSS
ncbi:MAG: deoxyribodipyrimidine photo-lyase [Candidatus Nanoarchaeia archaeon]